MARDLSVQHPCDAQNQGGGGGGGEASAARDQTQQTYQGCDRLLTTELDTSTESEGDGGGYSDQSYDHNDDLHCEGLQGESEQGEYLYRQFLARRLGEEQLNHNHPYARHAEMNYQQQDHLDTDLTTLAERFSRSLGREQVRQKAEQVEISSITQENFTMMLTELFHDGGITQERILVLFFFCSDLAIRAVRSGLQSAVSTLTRWTVGFLRGTVAAWVRCRGGWDSVLSGGVGVVNQLVFMGVCVAVITVCVCYVRKNW